MFANSPELLAQLSSIVRDHPSIYKYWEAELSLRENAIQATKKTFIENTSQFIKKPELEKLEERIDQLEQNNDQLLCIIHFLFEKISCLGGKSIQDPTLPQMDNKHTADPKCKPELTKREMDVFQLLEKGLCAKEIAQVLFISETTVITHKKNLKEKFHARNTVELISKVLGK